jgi:hypothetical protein
LLRRKHIARFIFLSFFFGRQEEPNSQGAARWNLTDMLISDSIISHNGVPLPQYLSLTVAWTLARINSDHMPFNIQIQTSILKATIFRF